MAIVICNCPLGQEQSRPHHWSLLRPLSSYIGFQYLSTLTVRRGIAYRSSKQLHGGKKDVECSSLYTNDVNSANPGLRAPVDRFIQPCVRRLFGISDCQ